MKEKGITIAEMLVVSMIICILVAILLPAIGMARRASRTVACGNNLRQLSIATFQYANRHSEMMPSAYYNTFAYIVPYLSMDANVWQCGSDIFTTGIDGIAPGGIGCSYAPNADRTGFVTGVDLLPPEEWAGWEGGQFSPWTVCTKDKPSGEQVFGRLTQNAADTMLFGESWRDRENYCSLGYLGWFMYGKYMNTVRARDSLLLRAYTASDISAYAFLIDGAKYHDGRMNVAFVDGHVRIVQIKELTKGPCGSIWTKHED